MAEENRIKQLNEGLNMFKQIKLRNKIGYFFKIFVTENSKFTNSLIKFEFLGRAPKVLLEFLGVFYFFS